MIAGLLTAQSNRRCRARADFDRAADNEPVKANCDA